MSIAAGNKNKYLAMELSHNLRTELCYDICPQILAQVPTFQPMEYAGLHMTIAYLGNLSQNLGPKNVKSGLADLGTFITEFNDRALVSLEFAGYELFSEKQNLIVARYPYLTG